MPKDTYTMTVTYPDGTKKTLETTDFKRAMDETSSACWQEDQEKTVMLMKGMDSLFTEKIKAHKRENIG